MKEGGRVAGALGALGLGALSLLLWLPRLSGPIDLRYDAGVYYVLGTALTEGKGYRLLYEPGEIEAIQYPPLLPVLIAVHQKALGTSDPSVVGRALRITFFLLFTGWLLAVDRVAARFLPRLGALVVAAVSGLYFHNYFLSDFCFAELPYAFLTALFFGVRGEGWKREAASGGLAAAACLARSAGIALLAAWIAEALFRRRPRQLAGRAAIALAAVLSWQAYLAGVTASDEYKNPVYAYQRAAYQFHNVGYLTNLALVDPFKPEAGRISARQLAGRFFGSLVPIPLHLGEAVSSTEGFWVWVLSKVSARAGLPAVPRWAIAAVLIGLGALTAAGAVQLARSGEILIPLYLLASVLLICLTSWPGHTPRYLGPLTPFLAICLARALFAFKRRAPAALVFAAVLAVQAGTAYLVFSRSHEPVAYRDLRGVEQRYRLFYYNRDWRQFDRALDWLRDRAAPGDVVATSTPEWVYLRTGRKAVFPPFEADPARALGLLDSVPVRYLIADHFEFLDVIGRYALPAVERFPGGWTLIYASPDDQIRIYQRVGPGEEGARGT
ncbi:MAG TPA: hypothetical protein VJ725_21720 [Thermoanaerobaculia bacterium]|nr:hypothetical protein [Thermoanaerobaculia bacterium]